MQAAVPLAVSDGGEVLIKFRAFITKYTHTTYGYVVVVVELSYIPAEYVVVVVEFSMGMVSGSRVYYKRWRRKENTGVTCGVVNHTSTTTGGASPTGYVVVVVEVSCIRVVVV